jgi:hypothetical protein
MKEQVKTVAFQSEIPTWTFEFQTLMITFYYMTLGAFGLFPIVLYLPIFATFIILTSAKGDNFSCLHFRSFRIHAV